MTLLRELPQSQISPIAGFERLVVFGEIETLRERNNAVMIIYIKSYISFVLYSNTKRKKEKTEKTLNIWISAKD